MFVIPGGGRGTTSIGKEVTISLFSFIILFQALILSTTAFSLASAATSSNNHNNNNNINKKINPFDIGIRNNNKNKSLGSIATTTRIPTGSPRTSTVLRTNNNKEDTIQQDGIDEKTMTTTTTTGINGSSDSGTSPSLANNSPRVQSCILMSIAMSLHFGGYEFARSAALALFTSSGGITGFNHPSAYPFAIGCVTPTTLSLLYWYGTILKKNGPRKALQKTTSLVIVVLFVGTILIAGLSSIGGAASYMTKAIVALLFVFQNSYAHLIYTQQWSFLGSVMTPTEGTRWFTYIAGLSSIVCTITASCVSSIATNGNGNGGLTALILLTCLTLTASMICSDRAYQLSNEYGFDPSNELQQKQQKKEDDKGITKSTSTSISTSVTDSNSKVEKVDDDKDETLLEKTKRMFQTSPILAGLFGEVITFQALSTVLNVCFVRQLKESIIIDSNRAAFTGKFYAGVNGSACIMQFLVLPLLRKYMEPQWVYRFLPLLLMPLLSYSAFFVSSSTSGLWIAAIAFFALKSTDYSIRNIANEMVYQPLDFDARYLGKEVIGVFANRFGKSGTSMILTGLTSIFGFAVGSTRPLSQLAVGVGSIWSVCSIYLSKHVITNKQAEEQVRQRSNSSKKTDADAATATNGDDGIKED